MRFFLLCLLIGASLPLSRGFPSEKTQNPLPYLIIIYGSQGSGRASIAARLRGDFRFPTIAPATHLSLHVLEETSLGKNAQHYFAHGGTMPPDLLVELISDRLQDFDCSQGALLENMPVLLEQVKSLHEALSSRFRILAISIDAADDWIIQKVEYRRTCRECGKVFDIHQNALRTSCDVCSNPLIQRQADTPEALKLQLDSYKVAISPLFTWFDEERILVHVSGERKFDDIYEEVVDIVERYTGLVATKTRHALLEE